MEPHLKERGYTQG